MYHPMQNGASRLQSMFKMYALSEVGVTTALDFSSLWYWRVVTLSCLLTQ